MATEKPVKYYSTFEENLNVGSHGFGLLLGLIGFVFLVVKAATYGDAWHITSFSIYGSSLVILYAASTLYHQAKNPVKRRRLKVFDHAAIYVLIAGSYTPYALITLKDDGGWLLFGLAWGIALIGIILKLFFTGRFTLLSTLAYVLMGWMAIFFITPMQANLSSDGMLWLGIGGVSYTVGAVIYAIHKIKLNHAIFHLFVLFGSISHFISVYFYVLEV